MRKLTGVAIWMVLVLGWTGPYAAGNTPKQRLEPLPAAEWDRSKAKHLLERAGFGGTPAEVNRLAAMSLADAVAYLVRFDGGAERHPAIF